MRFSKYFLPTKKEVPSDAEIISHKYMIKAGLMRKLGSGIYNYLPLCLKVIKKVESIIREEMNNAGAQELLMSILSPSELWNETGRWDIYGNELMKVKDRHERDFALGPTHEEIITNIVRHEINSYKQLPLCLYQVQTKFRDEIRPRFGVMRAREFIMKDAYSFHADRESLDEYYNVMYKAYKKIFERCGLRFRAVLADSGAIGGKETHEFMVLANSGESTVISCPNDDCGYAATDETADSKIFYPEKEEEEELKKVETPGKKSVEEVTEFLKVPAYKLVKTLIYKADDKIYGVLVRGDRDVQEIKLKNILGCVNLELADEKTVEEISGCEKGFSGPIGLKKEIELIVDESIKGVTNFVVGANEKDYHYVNVNIGRDLKIEKYVDIRFAVSGDKCVDCGAELTEYRGIEVGQIFKLGTKYSESMKAYYTDDKGQQHPFVMGCYGIGVSRIVAAAIEQNYDDNGIIWPIEITPFLIHIIPLNKKGSEEFKLAEKIYNGLKDKGIEVLFDDRDASPGYKFKDADLIGIPYRVVIGKKSLEQGHIEFSERRTNKKMKIPVSDL